MSRRFRVVTYLVLALWTLVTMFPLYWVAVTSIKDGRAITEGPKYLPFVDFTPSLAGWLFILTDAHEALLRQFANSVIVAACATVLCLVAGGLAAYGFTRFPLGTKGGALLMPTILATRVLPPMVLVVPIYIMAFYTGTLDTRLALIVIYTAVNLPVAVWLLRPVFGLKMSEQEEAAILDGASRLRVFFEIAVPMAAAGFAATGFLIFLLCWNEYLIAAQLAGNRAMTVPPWIIGQLSMKEAQVGGDEEEWVRLSAAMVLMVVPVLLLMGLVRRLLGRADLWRPAGR